VNELASQDDLNGAWPELWKYRRQPFLYKIREELPVTRPEPMTMIRVPEARPASGIWTLLTEGPFIVSGSVVFTMRCDSLQSNHREVRIMEIRMKVLRSSAAALLAVLGTIAGSTLAQTKDSAAPILSEQVTKCDDLVKLSPPDVTVTLATNVAAGQFTPPGSANALETPFCRVVAVARPTSDSAINFEVWIPPAEHWNHNFLGVGNGGYMGAIDYRYMARALNRGFATASTDTGHTDEDLRFAAGHPEKIVDWGYRSIHVMTELAKLIVRDYSGRFPRHSYFEGCSTGGEQALSEAQRFPADYDGVLAGDPGNDRVHLNVGFLWAFAATHDTNGNTILPNRLSSSVWDAEQRR